MGRRKHLAATLPSNLDRARACGASVEFVVLDYNSSDGLRRWVLSRFTAALEAGTVRYYRTDEPSSYSHAHAKNVAHRLARGDILCNLDADNLLGTGTIERILGAFQEDPRSIVHAGRGTGIAGRIGLRREDFEALGGYDEGYRGWGSDDLDLFTRATSGLGLRPVDLSDCGSAIRHRSRVRSENIPDLDQPLGPASLAALPPDKRAFAQHLLRRDAKLARSWLRNYLRLRRCTEAGVVRAQPPGGYGNARLMDRHGHEVTL